ncbi:MAG: dATP/dGTP pyrophosphohydrolase domain-containing protein [Aestuariivirga sp.]
MDLKQHLTRQMAWSRANFGPGARTAGIIDHIERELFEVESATDSVERSKEWTDVAILALDGLTRELWATFPEFDAPRIAELAVGMIEGKQGKNERRDWPDWRTADPNKAIEHIKGSRP